MKNIFSKETLLKILVLASRLNHGNIPQAFSKLSSSSKDYFFFNPKNLDDQELSKIDIIIGWDPILLPKILNLPHLHLKWIQAYSAGVDYYPLSKIAQRKVLMSTVSGIHAEPISENVIGMILSFYRGIYQAALNQTKRKWQVPSKLTTVFGKHILIFGTGHIGGRIAELAQSFKMKITGINHSGHPAEKFPSALTINSLDDKRIKNADIVVNTLPLTKQTKGLFNHKLFSKFKNYPLYVSVGRGPTTKTQDLITALKKKQIGGAALDVTDPEPLPSSNPLWQMRNVIITPHLSGLYDNYLGDVLKIFKENLYQFEKDGTLARNQVDLKAGY